MQKLYLQKKSVATREILRYKTTKRQSIIEKNLGSSVIVGIVGPLLRVWNVPPTVESVEMKTDQRMMADKLWRRVHLQVFCKKRNETPKNE